MLFYRWQLPHLLERRAKHTWMIPKFMNITGILSLESVQNEHNMSAPALPEKLTHWRLNTIKIEDSIYRSVFLYSKTSSGLAWVVSPTVIIFILLALTVFLTLFENTQISSFLSDSNEEFEEQIESEDFGGLRDIGKIFAQQGFFDDNEMEVAEISEELVRLTRKFYLTGSIQKNEFSDGMCSTYSTCFCTP